MFDKPDGQFERELRSRGLTRIAGLDEVGRGPLAGPVVVAGVMFRSEGVPQGLDDSKKLKASQREKLFEQIIESADISIIALPAFVIDDINIRRAALRGMSQAITALPHIPDLALVDGRDCPECACPVEAIIRGDAKIASIAAASIVAKVVRDRIMVKLDSVYPAYDFKNNMGYGTKKHLDALERHGPCPEHRKTFAPVKFF